MASQGRRDVAGGRDVKAMIRSFLRRQIIVAYEQAAKRTSRVRLSRPGQSLVIQTMKARSDLRSWSRHGVFHRDVELMAQMPFSASSRWRDLNG